MMERIKWTIIELLVKWRVLAVAPVYANRRARRR